MKMKEDEGWRMGPTSKVKTRMAMAYDTLTFSDKGEEGTSN